jgi:peroxiredoxin
MDTCMFSFEIDQEGVYFLRKAGPHPPDFSYVIYLKPGDNKSVELYSSNLASDFDSCRIGQPNAETICLQQWMNSLNAVTSLGVKRKKNEYIVAYKGLEQAAAQIKKNSCTTNRYFKKTLSSKLATDLLYARAAPFFYYGVRMNAGLDTAAEYKKFYQPLAGQKFCTTDILRSEHGLAVLNYSLSYQLFHKYGTQEQMLAATFIDKMKMICNDTVRAMYAAVRMQQVNSYEQFKKEILPFKKLFFTNDLKQAYAKKLDELTVFAQGAQAYNFSLKNTKDQVVSMSDFKGKVVVMDVWAMWCAPCLAEKPFFQAIEESFKERDDIVFVGVSHDGQGKKKAWKDFVGKKGYTSIELLAEYNESIGKYYKIEGIPRFMIFDKEGKIVTVDAPRPSNPKFKKLIEETLKIDQRVTNQ